MYNRTYYVHVNNDLYMEQMNHSVVIKLKINYFMLTFYMYFTVFRGEIGNFNLPVVNVKNQISPRNTAEFHRENRIFAAKKLTD